jgi:hypothetical protein
MFASVYAMVAVYFLMNKQALDPVLAGVPAAAGGALVALRGAAADSTPLRQTSSVNKLLAVPSHERQHQVEEAEAEGEAEDNIKDVVSDVVKCFTTYGELIIDVRKEWAPLGAARFVELVDSGHFTDLPFYRVCPKYLTQFGQRYFSEDKFDPDGLPPLKDDASLKGRRDMDYGYLFFAANEQNARKAEMAISFCEMVNCDVTALGYKAW